MLDEQSREDLIERITAIFTNEADAAEFNEDPDAYVDEHLPEGTEGADVASCMPAVAERTGLDFSNVASTGGGPSAAGQLSHTYQTIYQQNSYIYAEEGSQVTNIQGDGNAVAQQDVDVDIDVEYGEGEDTPPEETTEEAPDPVILREADDVEPDTTGDGGYDGSGINPDGLYDEPDVEGADPVEGGIDLSFENTADAGGAEAPVEEAPEPAPADDVPDM
jgi:hypothetical protein